MPVGINSTDHSTFNLIWSKLNTDLTNIAQKFKSATAPSSTAPLMWWFDTANSILKIRNEADSAWISLLYVDGSGNLNAVGPLRVNQNNDTITLSHDGTDVTLGFSDGKLIVKTDEGTDTDTVLAVQGKGTGKGTIELWDQSAANKVTVKTADAIGADRVFEFPSDTPADGEVLTAVGATGATQWAAAGGGGGFMAGNLLPNSAMTYWRSGSSAAPTYMYSTMSTISGSSSATKTDIGWKASVTCPASLGSDALFGWYSGSNGFTNGKTLDLKRLKGQSVTLGCWVSASTADRVKLLIYDGVGSTYSSAHSGGGGYEWLTVTRTIDSSATTLYAGLAISDGTSISADVELFCLVMGQSCGYWVAYLSRNKVHFTSYQVNNGWSNNDVATTGCDFSPVAVHAGPTIYYSGYCNSGGGAVLKGATTSEWYASNMSGAGTGYLIENNSGVFRGDLYSWDNDGITVRWSNSSGSNYYVVLTLHEGNPI